MMVIGGGNMGKKLSKEIPTQGSHSPPIFSVHAHMLYKQYIISFVTKLNVAVLLQELLQVHKCRVHSKEACGESIT